MWIHFTLKNIHSTNMEFPFIASTENQEDIDNFNLIRYRIKASGYDLLKLKLNNVMVFNADHQLNPNELAYQESDYLLVYPNTIKITDIALQENIFNNDDNEFLTVSIPIEPVFSDDETRTLFFQNSFNLSENKVDVRVKSNLINNIETIKTDVITKTKLKNDIFTINLQSPSKDVLLSTKKINAIKSKGVSKTKLINNIPIQSDSLINFLPKTISVLVKGNENTINNLKVSSISARLNFQNAAIDLVPIVVDTSEYIEILTYTPTHVALIRNK